jgi:hypothetical protein
MDYPTQILTSQALYLRGSMQELLGCHRIDSAHADTLIISNELTDIFNAFVGMDVEDLRKNTGAKVDWDIKVVLPKTGHELIHQVYPYITNTNISHKIGIPLKDINDIIQMIRRKHSTDEVEIYIRPTQRITKLKPHETVIPTQ